MKIKLIKTVLNVNFVNYFMNKSKIENKLEEKMKEVREKKSYT